MTEKNDRKQQGKRDRRDRIRLTFSHEVFGEGFYMVELSVNRLSEQADIIPLMVSGTVRTKHMTIGALL